MSNFKTLQLNEEDLTSTSSDEKMDTGSESLRSQDTPNSIVSSDFEDRDQPEQNVLRLQNPENHRSEPTLEDSNDSLVTKMTNLRLNTPKSISRPRNIGISPPKFSSPLTLATNHPLMGLGSPEENYPDLIPKICKNDDKDLSLSSIEDEKFNSTEFYSPERNTSKNNLYYSENFVTADSHIFNESLDTTQPDVACRGGKRKIIPKLNEDTSLKSREVGAIKHSKQISSQSTPKIDYSQTVDITRNPDFHCAVADWCESPSQLRLMPNFELPIELSSNVGLHNELESPDVISSSTQEDKSAYQALLDPYTGSVALRQTTPRTSSALRRKIEVPPQEDSCSLDSVSACSMESEDEPPEPEPPVDPPRSPDKEISHEDDDKQSKSTNTISECSDPIPEYSAAEELSNERSWVTVPRDGCNLTCDMKVIDPYKRVLSHGGYDSRGVALIVFSACHLPDNARTDYTYVMDNLFLYVIWTLERLVTDEYILVYLHGSAGRRRLPTFHWLHECYKLIDRRLRKSLQHLYLVHPTFWLKTFVVITKPFVSSKFFRKLSYVRSLAELMEKVPVEPNAIPEMVKEFDATKR